MNNSLENEILDEFEQTRRTLKIILINGFQFKGVVTRHDDMMIEVFSNGEEMHIYKHAISTIIN